MKSEDLKTLNENKTNGILSEVTENSTPKSILIFNPSKNSLKFIPNPNYAEELVKEIDVSLVRKEKPDLVEEKKEGENE